MGSGTQEHPISVDDGQGTDFSPINFNLGSLEFPIVVEDDMALAIPALVTHSITLVFGRKCQA